MRHILIIIVMLVISGCCCDRQGVKENKVYGPYTSFTTEEWKECFDECAISMPRNLARAGVRYSKETIDGLCVDFCRQALYRKRGVKD